MGQGVSQIIVMLKGMKRDLEDLMAQEADRYFWEQNDCHDDIKALEELIYRSEFDLVKYKNLIALDEDILEDRQAELLRKQEELVRIQGFEATFKEERDYEVQKFEHARHEHEAVRNVILQCKKIMSERLTAREGEERAPGNFLEKPHAFV